jgi:hypothetical protein
MSLTSRSRTIPPPAPATLPDGTLDCEPELPNPFVDSWEVQQIARASRWVNVPDPQPRWVGTATEFAEWVREEWEAGKITASNLTAALGQGCNIYVQKNGQSQKRRQSSVVAKIRQWAVLNLIFGG